MFGNIYVNYAGIDERIAIGSSTMAAISPVIRETRSHCRDRAQRIKQQSVSWNLQVEIHETVDQDSTDAEYRDRRDCRINIGDPPVSVAQRRSQRCSQKPDSTRESHNSRLGEQLQVIVVSFIN